MHKAFFLAVFTGFLLYPSSPARADDQAELKALIGKAIQVRGGTDNLVKYKAVTFKAKGRIQTMGGIDFTGDWQESEGRFRFSFDMNIMGQAVNTTEVLAGEQGWLKVTVGGNAVLDMELTKEMVDEAKEEVYANRVMSLVAFAAKDQGLELSPLGEVVIHGRPCIGIRISKKDRRDVSIFIDKESSLVVKGEHRIKDFQEGGKEFNEEYFLGEYRDFDGIKEAIKLTIRRDGEVFLEMEITEFKHLEKLDDAMFQKP